MFRPRISGDPTLMSLKSPDSRYGTLLPTNSQLISVYE